MSMFQSISCRLCINICNGHRSLCDEDGRRNGVYALMEKYFASVLLNLECVDNFTVICMECWRHIFEFHSFQQSVLLAQKMIAVNKQTEDAVKPEVENQLGEEEFITIRPKSIATNAQFRNELHEDLTNTSTLASCHDDDAEQQSEVIVKSEVEDIQNDGVIDSSSDDEAVQQSEDIVKSEVEYIEYMHITDYVSRNSEVLTENAASTVSQGPDSASCGEKSEKPGDLDEQWEESEFENAETTDSESDRSAGSFSTDDEMPLAIQTRRSHAEQKMENPKDQESIMADPSTTLGGSAKSTSEHSVPNDNKAKRKITSSKYIKAINLKRPLTVQDYDNFIAQWRPQLECVMCSESCSNFSLLRQHFDKQHPGEKCHITCCQHKFFQRCEIEKHIRYHTEPKAFQCDQCFDSFTSKCNLQGHLQRVHSGKPKDEKLLKKTTQVLSDTEKTSTAEQVPKWHTCEECGKVYKFSLSLLRHKKEFHEIGAVKSAADSESAKRKCERIAHKTKKLPLTVQEYDDFIAQWLPNLECAICSETCSTFSLLRQHFDKQHPDEKCHITCCQHKFYQRFEIEKHIRYHIEPKAFKCEQCFDSFTSKCNLLAHLQRVHSEKPNAEKSHDKTSTTEPGSKGHTCEECGKVYTCFSNLWRHKRGVHVISTVKCAICDKGYNNAQSLKVHMATHAEKQMFSCTFCTKTFTYRATMYVHLKKEHHSEWEKKRKAKLNSAKEKKPLKCTICDKVFMQPDSLREHLATHAGKALYNCLYCSKTYNYRSNFSYHMRKIHPTERQ